MSATSARAKVARAMSLRDGFARTRMAWLSGQISDDMVRVITTGIPLALQRLNVAEQPALVDQLEAQIVPYSIERSIPEVRAKLTRLRIALDADGVDARSLAAYDEQQLTLGPVGDGYEVRGYLTKESAAVLLTVLEQKIDGWFHDGSLTPEQKALTGDDVISTGRRKMRRHRLNAWSRPLNSASTAHAAPGSAANTSMGDKPPNRSFELGRRIHRSASWSSHRM